MQDLLLFKKKNKHHSKMQWKNLFKRPPPFSKLPLAYVFLINVRCLYLQQLPSHSNGSNHFLHCTKWSMSSWLYDFSEPEH